MTKLRDLSDMRFGRLLVVSIAAEKTKSGNYRWDCVCDCGNQKTLPSDHLVRRKQPVRSCGCLRDDRTRQAVSPDPDAVAFRLLLGAYKKRARLKQIQFTLSDDLFRTLTSSNCRYCGQPPTMTMQNKSGTGEYTYNSIDRLDPSIGYTEINSAPCCKTCNYMKWTLTDDEFLRHVVRIAERSGKCGN